MSTARGKRAKKKANINKSKTAMLAICFVVLVLLLALVVLGVSLDNKIETSKLKVDSLEEQILGENDRTQEIEDLENYMKSDEYIEQIAKEKLGYVKDGEIIFKETD